MCGRSFPGDHKHEIEDSEKLWNGPLLKGKMVQSLTMKTLQFLKMLLPNCSSGFLLRCNDLRWMTNVTETHSEWKQTQALTGWEMLRPCLWFFFFAIFCSSQHVFFPAPVPVFFSLVLLLLGPSLPVIHTNTHTHTCTHETRGLVYCHLFLLHLHIKESHSSLYLFIPGPAEYVFVGQIWLQRVCYLSFRLTVTIQTIFCSSSTPTDPYTRTQQLTTLLSATPQGWESRKVLIQRDSVSPRWTAMSHHVCITVTPGGGGHRA